MAMEGKRRILRREWKTPREMSTTGPGSEPDDGESWMMMMHRTHKKQVCDN